MTPPPPHTPYKPFPPTHTNPLAPFGWSCCWTCCWTRSTCYWTRRTITTLATGNRLPRRLPTRRTRRTRRTCRTCRTSSNTFIGRVGRVGRIGRWLPQKSGNRRERNILLYNFSSARIMYLKYHIERWGTTIMGRASHRVFIHNSTNHPRLPHLSLTGLCVPSPGWIFLAFSPILASIILLT